MAHDKHSAASIGLRTFGGPSANAGYAARRIARLARGSLAFFFGLRPARLWRLFTLTLAAAEGEQDGNDEPVAICPLICGEL